MKIRWRQHELTLVIATALIALAGYLFDLYHNGTNQFANPFIETRTPFNFYKNELLPHIIVGLSACLAYLWFSLYTIPRLLFPKKREAGTSKISLSFSKISFKGLAKKQLKNMYGFLYRFFLSSFYQVLCLLLPLFTGISGNLIILGFLSSSMRIIQNHNQGWVECSLPQYLSLLYMVYMFSYGR